MIQLLTTMMVAQYCESTTEFETNISNNIPSVYDFGVEDIDDAETMAFILRLKDHKESIETMKEQNMICFDPIETPVTEEEKNYLTKKIIDMYAQRNILPNFFNSFYKVSGIDGSDDVTIVFKIYENAVYVSAFINPK